MLRSVASVLGVDRLQKSHFLTLSIKWFINMFMFLV